MEAAAGKSLNLSVLYMLCEIYANLFTKSFHFTIVILFVANEHEINWFDLIP